MNASAIGRVERTLGELIVARVPAARIGDAVRIETAHRRVAGEVASIAAHGAVIVPRGPIDGIAAGDPVALDADMPPAVFGLALLGRAIDGSGVPIDGGDAVRGRRATRVSRRLAPADRRSIAAPLWTGVRAVDGLLTIGRGARVGMFGAPGTGKTSLLETIAASVRADAVVVALVGERGREAEQWLRRLHARITIVCATSDRCASERALAAETAMDQAAMLSEHGLNVLLIVDSLARYAHALREIRCGLGEPVGRGGYPPIVFSQLARLVERAGDVRLGIRDDARHGS